MTKEEIKRHIFHLKYAHIRCKEIIIAIEYELLMNERHPNRFVDMREIKTDLEVLCDDIEMAENGDFIEEDED